MLKNIRSICLDVCDYDNNVICNIYDNTADISGQATEIFVRTERNGWKELSFSLPSTCITEEGIEDNYRLKYLIADYRIRLQTDKETDWYIISGPKIIHDKRAKTVEVTAGHICQLLKTKNLNLEFSDEEGNNVGTAGQILETILDGTGWKPGNIAEFLEDDGVTVKVRSIVASAKTGAFMLISNLCEKFDAKPIYHGEGRIVDLVPMNPFSEVEGAEIPKEVLEGENVLELYYGHNVSNLSRTLNTENLVTRLYAYGSYGDKTNGLCSLMTITHTEYTFDLASYASGTEFEFTDKDNATRYFTVNERINNHQLVWSDFDQQSRTYVWNNNTQKMYEVYEEPKKTTWVSITGTQSQVQNWFEYLTNFTYYDKIGLLTDEMKQQLASFQRNMPATIQASVDASTTLLEKEMELSKVAESNTGFLRLDVQFYTEGEDREIILNLNKNVYEDGVIYRSDYDEARRNYFSWYCASALKANGDPVSGIGSVVYIIHDTNPVTWHKAYVKEIDGVAETMDYSIRDRDDPDTIMLWLDREKVPAFSNNDRFYLFSTNSISGRLGVRESEIESMQETIQQTTKVVTEEHPTYFVWDTDSEPDIDDIQNGYGWYYRTYTTNEAGKLYFCYGIAGEDAWHEVIVSETDPTVVNHGYYFNLKNKVLYHGEGNKWINIAESSILVPSTYFPQGQTYNAPTTESKRLSQSFSKVSYYCSRYDMLHKGLYDKYKYTVTANSGLQPGNYAFRNDYGFYWVFSTDMTIEKGKTIWLDTVKYLVYQNDDVANVVTPEAKPYDAIDFPIANELAAANISKGTLSEEEATKGTEENSDTLYRTNHITVYPNTKYAYSLPANSKVFYYDQNRRCLSFENLSASGNFTTPARAKYTKYVVSTSNLSGKYVRVYDYANQLFVKETQYTILKPLATEGDRTGMLQLIKDFADIADECYITCLPAYNRAQKASKEIDDALKESLGDLYREGYWQKNEYVEGDEDKLYKDTLKNLDKISKPEATYDVTFLDLYSSNKGMGYSIDENLDDIEWPDIEITDAVHLVDPEIDINCWAFIDRLDKCYDQPWKTSITINTDLSLIAQHSFTDVLARIAEVANETSANQTIYKRAAAISGTGAFTAKKLEGTINTNVNLLTGGASNWHQDSKGNFVFESADGQSAMMLTGYGWAVANGKDANGDWLYRYTTTGQGMTADFLAAGEISAQLLTAGSITTDKLNASVGQELEIGSNKSLMLYATVDGYRPSGSLMTQVDKGDGKYEPVGEGDSYIQIAAKKGNKPAYIDVKTGGTINLYSGSGMTLVSDATMDLKSNSQMTLEASKMYFKSNSELNIEATGKINIKSNGSQSVSGEVNIESNGKLNIKSSGKMSIKSGGEMILESQSDMYVNSKASININSGGNLKIDSGGKFIITSTNFSIDEDGNVSMTGKVDANTGSIAGFAIKGTYNETTKKWENQYMCTQNATISSTSAGIYLGYQGLNLGGKFIYNVSDNLLTAKVKKLEIGSTGNALITLNATSADKASITLSSANTITISAESTVNVEGGEEVKIVSGSKKIDGVTKYGIVKIGHSTKPFIISSDGTNGFIRNGIEKFSDTDKNGIYLGTDGILLGKAKFKVTNEGILTATDADITGSIKAKSGHIGVKSDGTGGWKIGENRLSDDDETIKLWGGKRTSGNSKSARIEVENKDKKGFASFIVWDDGSMDSTKGSIAGWTIDEKSLTGLGLSTGMSIGELPVTDNGHKNEIAFWAGSSDKTSAPFRVTHGGVLTATGANLNTATVSGNIEALTGNIGGTKDAVTGVITGGWAINATKIYSNNFKTGIACDTGDTSIAFWAGANSSSEIGQSNFRVTNGGKLVAKDGIFEGQGVFYGDSSFYGKIIAKEGTIGGTLVDSQMTGGWTIANNLISSGTKTDGTDYVGLSSDISSIYAIWAGAKKAQDAPFAVDRNGNVRLNRGNFGMLNLSDTGFYILGDKVGYFSATYGGLTFQSLYDGTDTIFQVINTASAQHVYAKTLYGETLSFESITADTITGVEYGRISGRPTKLSDLDKDLKVGDFDNDAGYITSYTNTWRPVPEWKEGSWAEIDSIAAGGYKNISATSLGFGTLDSNYKRIAIATVLVEALPGDPSADPPIPAGTGDGEISVARFNIAATGGTMMIRLRNNGALAATRLQVKIRITQVQTGQP